MCPLIRPSLSLAIALGATAVVAEPVAAPPAPPDCTGAAHRAFDFWIGSWQVTSQDQFAGRNTISATLDGCALLEQWQGAKGTTGSSLNVYDRQSKRWRQFWVDNRGGVLRLEGGLNAQGAMVLGSTDGTVHQRITWSKLEDGSVRQLWEQSNDAGKSWTVAFDGHYRRDHAAGDAPSAP
jgi:hypothetical protein